MALKSINGILKADIKSINGVLAAIAAAGFDVVLLDTLISESSVDPVVSATIAPKTGSHLFIVATGLDRSFASGVSSTFTVEEWIDPGWDITINSGKDPTMEVWYAKFVTGSGTVSVDYFAANTDRHLSVYEVTGHNTENPFINYKEGNDETGATTDITLTLDATPASDSIVFGAVCHMSNSAATGDVTTPGSEFAELNEEWSSGFAGMWAQTQYNNNASPSADIVWANLERFKAFLGFEIQKKGTGDGADLGTDLAAWWDMDEASGSRADAHTNGYTMTDNNTVTTMTAKVGTNAALFAQANSEYLSRANGAEAWQMGTGDITVCAWVNFTSFGTGSPQIIFSCGGRVNGEEGYEVGVDAVGQDSYIQMSNGTTRLRDVATAFDIASPLSTSTWYYFIWNFDRSGNVTLSINDSAQTSFSLDISSQSADDIQSLDPLRISSASGAVGRHVDGGVDELAVWNRLLTAAEKTWLYNSGSGRAYSELG